MEELESLRSLIFRLMDKADNVDNLIREISVETEANTTGIKAINERCVILHSGFDPDAEDLGLPTNKKDAVKLFKGMTGRQKFILLLVWGVVMGLGLIAFILSKVQIL